MFHKTGLFIERLDSIFAKKNRASYGSTGPDAGGGRFLFNQKLRISESGH